ncbi:DUF3857 and transglutaminase domain-containing protein [Terriglobus aquaticus]|uniref:DUF3857 domain-containing protein n=1 Tax=Terriglobus aquaticus TaxID=940139 RepID=A0ABW9KMP3_9BACT|nr:DUF3857 and transglutaminase domain-containing protein [Terriglobus aquaticus]
MLSRRLVPAALLATALACSATLVRAQAWIAPTPEELKMTSLPEQPGAKAVVLNVDELCDDDNHMRSFYKRIKILTEAGKDLGDVRIIFDRRRDGGGWTVDEVAGRTIQPDGTIVPFTGKPYEKVLEKTKTDSFRGKVFSMPAVQVGSIIEYRYKLRWDDRYYQQPFWDVQDEDLYIRKAHFLWRPTQHDMFSVGRGGRESLVNTLVWHPVLPAGQQIKNTVLASGKRVLELDLHDIPAFSSEEYMPPSGSAMYHVDFYYSPYHTPQEFWNTEGKYWSSDANKFIGNSDFVRKTAQETIAGATTDEDKLRKLYALTQKLQNTDYTRRHDSAEDKQEGLKQVKSAEDVLLHKRGSSDEITRVFVALARAAGMNASLMISGDRSRSLVDANWLEMGQLRDEIAIVNYNGADHFFDPGTPYTTFGHLAWEHTFSGGVRQKDKETALVQTMMDTYKFSRTTRVADLKLQETGAMSGTVTMTWQGSPATVWRQRALRTDNDELREQLKTHLEHMMPGGTEVTVRAVENLTDPDQPLKVLFGVEGHLGTPAGSRVILPSDIFVANKHTTFPHEHRDQPVYFQYPESIQDAMRITLPAGYTLESVPKNDRVEFKTYAIYSQSSKQDATSVTIWRNLSIGEFYYPLNEYNDLRAFYSSMEQKDQNAVILKRASTEKASLQ